MAERRACVQVLASKERGTLYVGVTPDLIKRIWQHQNNPVDGFTRKYRVTIWFGTNNTAQWKPQFFARRRSRNGNARGSWN
ncbi:MAG TPA: GIY-YIG nuclease family protein [Rhodanobacteraceae bacterium]|nr:GIY-YIG nuclease family protein [Rhodanobacteraceae bacterium]